MPRSLTSAERTERPDRRFVGYCMERDRGKQLSRRQRVGLAALYPMRQVDCMRCAGRHQGLRRHDQDRVAKFLPNNPLANEIREDINIDNAWNWTIRPGPYCRQRINSERFEIRIGALSEVSECDYHNITR
jgi:hypothetical protein